MRITRQTLLKIAKDIVSRRIRTDRDLFAAYLHGILTTERDPILGGTADIDLVFIHEFDHPAEREIVRLTDEVHLDITHHSRELYRQARSLRVHPWLGPTIYHCQLLHDPRHFLDFTQASVRAHFFRADTVLARAQKQLETAREIWFSFQFGVDDAGLREVLEYFRAVANVANAIASLSGGPLSERRFLLDFPARAEAVGRPGLFAGLLGLLGGPAVGAGQLQTWLPAWESAYKDAGSLEDGPLHLHPHRYPYYRRMFTAVIQKEQPLMALWPLLSTWLSAIEHLPQDYHGRGAWRDCLQTLGLLGDGFAERVAALDAYLDMAEELLEAWASSKGVGYGP